ncbi:MAG: response regulator [Calditrichaeota bacterium]|nr:MAG: response regulator [Calditrichota bacterium]
MEEPKHCPTRSAQAASAHAQEQQNGPVRILIVDDEVQLYESLVQFLNLQGFQATGTHSIEEAQSLLDRERFDLVISDVHFPNHTARDLFDYARKHHPEVAFMFMTGNPDLDFAIDLLRQGGYDYIIKPFGLTDLLNKVRTVLEKVEQRRRQRHLVDDLRLMLDRRLNELRIYQDIFECAEEGLLILDTEGNIVKANQGFERLSGLEEQALFQRSLEELCPHIFPDLPLDQVRETLQKTGRWSGEQTAMRSDGQPWVSNVSIFPIRDDKGKLFAYGAFVKDVTSQRSVEKALIQSLERTTLAQEAIIFGLARLAEYRDKDTGLHLERIRNYCKILAEALADHPRFQKKVNTQFIKTLYSTAPLHDIGKVGIPDYILLKPGKLTKLEFEIMKTHTIIGYQTLSSIKKQYGEMDFLNMGIEITYYHHEKYDGTGYPVGLRGESIPLSAQILAVADVYDALTSKRVYKEAFTHQVTLDIMRSERGKHFAPELLDVFLSVADQFQLISRQFSEAPEEEDQLNP